MARLTATQRYRMPSSDFAGPGRSFPIPDKNHAKAAIVDSARAVSAGHISSSQRATIVAKAQRMLKQ